MLSVCRACGMCGEGKENGATDDSVTPPKSVTQRPAELEVIALIVCWRADNTKIILNFALRGILIKGRRSDQPYPQSRA